MIDLQNTLTPSPLPSDFLGKIAIISSNDLKIRLMDINRLNFFKTMAFDWAVNVKNHLGVEIILDPTYPSSPLLLL